MYEKIITLIPNKKTIITVFLISFLIPLMWYRPGKIIGGGEEGLSFYNPQRTSGYYQDSWYEMQGGSPLSLAKSRYPVFYILGKINYFGVPNNILQISLFALLSAVAGTGMYQLASTLDPKTKYFPAIASIFYLFNPYTYANIWHRFSSYSFFFYALLPISLYLYIAAIKNKKVLLVIVFIILSTVLSYAFSSPSTILTYWFTLFVTSVYYTLNFKHNQKNILLPLVYFTLYLTTWIISSWWWLKSLISNSSGIYNSVFSAQSNLDILRSISSQYPFSIFIRLAYPSVLSSSGNLMTYPMLVIILLGGIIALRKKNIFPILLTILGVLIINGTNFPFGQIVEFFFVRFSFLQVFRNPYEKLGIILSIGYSFLFSWGLIKILKARRVLGLTFICLALFGWVIPIWGSVFGSEKVNAYVAIPSDYQKINTYLNAESSNFRVLDLPILPGDGSSNVWPNGNYYGLTPTEFLIDKPVFSRLPRQGSVDDYWKYLRKSFFLGNISQMAKYANIKYMLLHSDIDPIYSGTESFDETSHVLNSGWLPTGTGKKIHCEINKPCKIDGTLDLRSIKFLTLSLTSHSSGDIRLDLYNDKPNHLVFNSESDPQYRITSADINQPKKLIFDLRTPTELYKDFNISEVAGITLSFKTSNDPSISLAEITLDEGKENQTSGLSKVFKTELLTLYKVNNEFYKERIYVVNEIKKLNNWEDLIYLKKYPDAFVIGDIAPDITYVSKNMPVVRVQKISSAKYLIKTDDTTSPYWLIFSDSYNPNWVLSGNKGSIPHFMVNGFSNGFFINPHDGFNLELKFQ